MYPYENTASKVISTHTDLFTVNVQLLEWVDRDQNVSHIGIDESLLVPLPKLRHQHTLKGGGGGVLSTQLALETGASLASSMSSSEARSSTIFDVASSFISFLYNSRNTFTQCTKQNF